MIKFLLICIIIAALYLFFNIVAEFDMLIHFTFLNYQVETTIFTCLIIFIITQLVFTLVLKLLFLILGLPKIIQRNWRDYSIEKGNQKLIRALGDLLVDDKIKLASLVKEIGKISNQNNQEIINLILAKAAINIEDKIEYFTKLINGRYSVYAARQLARIFLEGKEYNKAENYAVKAFNEDDTNIEIMLLLIQIYGKLEKWLKLTFIVTKLQKMNYQFTEQETVTLAGYYYQAAIFYLKENSDQEALRYLETSLELAPSEPATLNLFVELNNNSKNIPAIIKLLKNAFILKPSFYLAKLYIKNTNYSALEVYHNLSLLAEPAKYQHVFLAIAADLDLEQKISELKSL